MTCGHFPRPIEQCSRLKQGYDLELMKNIRLIEAWPEGKVVWELDITPFYANLNGVLYWKPLASSRINTEQKPGVMHGGAAGVIFGW